MNKLIIAASAAVLFFAMAPAASAGAASAGHGQQISHSVVVCGEINVRPGHGAVIHHTTLNDRIHTVDVHGAPSQGLDHKADSYWSKLAVNDHRPHVVEVHGAPNVELWILHDELGPYYSCNTQRIGMYPCGYQRAE